MVHKVFFTSQKTCEPSCDAAVNLSKLGQDFNFMAAHARARWTFPEKKKAPCLHFNKCNTCFGKQGDFEQSHQWHKAKSLNHKGSVWGFHACLPSTLHEHWSLLVCWYLHSTWQSEYTQTIFTYALSPRLVYHWLHYSMWFLGLLHSRFPDRNALSIEMWALRR